MNGKILSAFTNEVNNHIDDIRAAQKAYITAKTLEETIRSQAEYIQRKILAENEYFICEKIWLMENHRGLENRRITNPNNTYLMDEDIFLNDFLEKCYTEYLKSGIADKRGKEYMPEAEAHDLRRQAEKLLLDLAIDILPNNMQSEKSVLTEAKSHWKYREQLLELIMSI